MSDHAKTFCVLVVILVVTALCLMATGCASYTETMPDGTRRALHIVGTGKRSASVEASKATWSHEDIPETLNAAGGAVGVGARAAAGVP